MTSETDLTEGLRAVAAALDAATPATDLDAVKERRSAPAPARRGAALLAVAAVIVLVAAGGWALTRTDDPEVRIQTPVSDPATTDAPSTTDGPTPETAPAPGPVVVDSAWDGVPFGDLPEGGVAFVEDGTVTVATWAGEDLGSFPADLLPTLGSESGQVLDLAGGTVEVRSRVHQEADDCRSTGRAGIRAAVCGAEQEQLVTLDPFGDRSPVSGLPGAGIGRWQWAEPSPDGEWLLAQYSAECEVPFAMVVRPDGSDLRTVDGFADLSAAATSGAVGWTPDGRAVAVLPETACGSAAEEPGVYAIDPDTGEADLLRPGGRVGAVVWRNVEGGNERERHLARVLAELGREGCCGEPAHGSSSVVSGVVWDGVDVPIIGSDDDGVVEVSDLGDVVSLEELAGGNGGTSGTSGDAPFVVFSCGDTTWFLGGTAIGDEPAPLSVLREVALALIPQLTCSLGVVPQVRRA